MRTLEVGDKIEILVDNPQEAPVKAGQIVTVAHVRPDEIAYAVEEGGRREQWYASPGLEGVTWRLVEPVAPKLTRRHFMLDIETTGIDPTKEDLLQIGMLVLDFKDGFWHPGAAFRLDQGTRRQPESEFAKKHMVELYESCNRLDVLPAETLRKEVTDFFRQHGGTGSKDTFLVGWNASNFDVPFLVHKGALVPNTYETGPDGKDVMVGDFHYQIYEIGGALSLAMDVLNRTDRKALVEEALTAYPEIQMPEGKQHDALYDCYRQARILNGLIRLTREGKVG